MTLKKWRSLTQTPGCCRRTQPLAAAETGLFLSSGCSGRSSCRPRRRTWAPKPRPTKPIRAESLSITYTCRTQHHIHLLNSAPHTLADLSTSRGQIADRPFIRQRPNGSRLACMCGRQGSTQPNLAGVYGSEQLIGSGVPGCEQHHASQSTLQIKPKLRRDVPVRMDATAPPRVTAAAAAFKHRRTAAAVAPWARALVA
jgi:hypothetical protein